MSRSFAELDRGGTQAKGVTRATLKGEVLKAHVQDHSGKPAQRGEVIFQDCEVKNSPGPSAACDSGSGVWAHVFQMSVDASGNALVDYGFISIPETIGFRFRYIGQGSGIANGASKPGDVTWF